MKFDLVPYWKRLYRMFSVQALILQSAFLVGWAQLPEDLKTAIPTWLLCGLALIILGLGVYGAILKQPKVTDNDKPI